jgi:hypothetical protein
MQLDDDKPQPVTASEAAARLNRNPVTIRTWVTRFHARRLGRVNRIMYYDLRDLKVIEREIWHGHPVPATWQERTDIRLRCPIKTQEAAPIAA